MRTTEKSEKIEIQEATADLARARMSLEAAKDASRRANAGILDPLITLEDDQWVRVALAERREKDAFLARRVGELRRSRVAKWRAFFGVTPSPPTIVPELAGPAHGTATEETHHATVAFVQKMATHSEEEDLHPTRLDAPAADLERALATSALERKKAKREARDA